ncbi:MULTISPECIES: hypothetical protein [unclassified Sphingomonas]|uniref:hypothetical protein n=1 Tax=unclassified Sphingomonas TaxID=196159 RepID=UPI0021507A6B|nr:MULTISPECIES: hypothetical protein [unclassified Sphingomonas]MCR5871082.1 hypothetical protein [Sphingomonas sp. J344]UUY00601.1 hypothetical protein LRS08_05830 [Sphingomonas sp. J315]
MRSRTLITARQLLLAAVISTASLFAAGPATAQIRDLADPAPKILPDNEGSEAAEALVLGYRLADYARATKDARAMIVAAKIVESAPVKEGTDKGTLDSGAKAEGSAKPLTGADLFAEAAQFAAGDADLLAEIETARADAGKGIVCPCNSIRTTQYVPAKTVWTVRATFRGGEPKVIGMRRDSATPLALKVFDENGGLACQDMSGNVTLYCRVNPIWTGPFSIQAINLGETGTGVALVTN